MKKRLCVMIAGAAIAVAPFALAGGAPAEAVSMTCAAEPPIDTACDVVFGVLGVVCNGNLPSPPPTIGPPIQIAAMARPDLCPPLG